MTLILRGQDGPYFLPKLPQVEGYKGWKGLTYHKKSYRVEDIRTAAFIYHRLDLPTERRLGYTEDDIAASLGWDRQVMIRTLCTLNCRYYQATASGSDSVVMVVMVMMVITMHYLPPLGPANGATTGLHGG
jgi:hypothetical protein